MLKWLFLLIGLIYPVIGSGFNVGGSNSDSMWVADQTSLTGGTVDINVGGKTTVTGAVVAAVDADGNDNGNLTLKTNELEYNDLHDYSTSSESGFGFSTSVGGNTDKGIASAKPQGSTTISMTDKGSESEQETRATIGMGNITVGGEENPELAGLNRDLDKSQEVTKDMITGALDGSVTIDNNQLINNPTSILTNPWNAPNTTLGLGLGMAGMPFGAEVSYNEKLGALEFKNNPLTAIFGDGVTPGNTISYLGDPDNPNSRHYTYEYLERYNSASSGNKPSATDADRIDIRAHESMHLPQSRILGPLYIPVYILSGANSSSNWMEKAADSNGNKVWREKNGK